MTTLNAKILLYLGVQSIRCHYCICSLIISSIAGALSSPAIDFVPTEVQRLREFPVLLPLPDLVCPVHRQGLVNLGNAAERPVKAGFGPRVPQSRILPDQVLALAEHGEESSPQGAAERSAELVVVAPVVVGAAAAIGRLGKLEERILIPSQIQKFSSELLVSAAQLQEVWDFEPGPVPDLVADSVDFVDGLMHERGNLAGNHSDLPLLGPGHKLISFCHNSNVFQ